MNMIFKPIKKKARIDRLAIRCKKYPSKSAVEFYMTQALADKLSDAVDVMESECGNFICIQEGVAYRVNKTSLRLNCPDLQKYMVEGVYEFRELDGVFICDLREVQK